MARTIVRMIADFDTNGKPTPVKFKFENEQEETVTIKVGHVCKRDENNFAGNKMYRYFCETSLGGIAVSYELRYEVDTCKWFIYD